MGTNFQVVSIEIVWITIHIRSFWLKWFHIYFFFYHSSNSLYSAVNTGWFCCFAFISIYKLNVKRKVCNDAGDSFSHITMAKSVNHFSQNISKYKRELIQNFFAFRQVPWIQMHTVPMICSLQSVRHTNPFYLFKKFQRKKKIGIWKFYL